MKLFGIGKAPFNRFLAPSVNIFPLVRVSMAVDAVIMFLPDVASDYLGEIC